MMLKEFDKAKSIYNNIISKSPVPVDYLNMGHLALAMSDENNALNYYKLFITQGGLTIDDFAQSLQKDAKSLEKIDIDTSIIPLIVDAVSYATC